MGRATFLMLDFLPAVLSLVGLALRVLVRELTSHMNDVLIGGARAG